MTLSPRVFSPFALLLGLGLAAGCSHRGEPETSATTPASAPRSSPGHTARERAAASASLHPVFFAFDSAELTPEGKTALDENIALFNLYPRSKVLIAGHTDEQGDLTYNLNLGEARASTVRTYLTDHGIDLGRIVISSHGEAETTEDVSTPAESKADRRTEFVMVWEAPPGPAPIHPEG